MVNDGINIILSASLGAIIWAISPTLTGFIEPWDSSLKYYVICLFAAGVIIGIVCHKNLLCTYIGIVAGQLIYIVLLGQVGPLLSIGILFLIILGLATIAGAALGSRFRSFISEFIKGSKAGA